MESLYRLLSGQSLTRQQLMAAGIFVMAWFLMDVVQFVGYLLGK